MEEKIIEILNKYNPATNDWMAYIEKDKFKLIAKDICNLFALDKNKEEERGCDICHEKKPLFLDGQCKECWYKGLKELCGK